MQKNTFHHLTLSVDNLDKSQEFYEKIGFSYNKDFKREDYPAKFRDLTLGSFCLRLVEFQGSKKPLAECFENPVVNFQTIGLKHFSLEVTDISSFLAEFESSLIDEYGFKKSEMQKGVSGVRYAFLRDLDGNIIEVIEQIR